MWDHENEELAWGKVKVIGPKKIKNSRGQGVM